MIISIDGYDGTGKTTLAKKLAEHYGFLYLDKPVIAMVQHQKKCSYEEATQIVKGYEKELYAHCSKAQIACFYNRAFVWLKNFSKNHNIILDRGILTTYAVVGYPETEALFDHFLKAGAFLQGSIYLTADDEERVRRIYKNDPNDIDLKHPTKWHENNLEEYATERGLNFYKIKTDGKTPDEILQEAIHFIDNLIELQYENEKTL